MSLSERGTASLSSSFICGRRLIREGAELNKKSSCKSMNLFLLIWGGVENGFLSNQAHLCCLKAISKEFLIAVAREGLRI